MSHMWPNTCCCIGNSAYVTVTCMTLSSADDALCITVRPCWPLACKQPATEPQAKDSLYLPPRSELLKRASKFVASPKSSGHRTSHLVTSISSSSSSICRCPPSLFPLPQGALRECRIYSEIFLLPLFLSLISPSICFLPVFPARGGGVAVWMVHRHLNSFSLPFLLFSLSLKENIV